LRLFVPGCGDESTRLERSFFYCDLSRKNFLPPVVGTVTEI
jgi:hypothetical protein